MLRTHSLISQLSQIILITIIGWGFCLINIINLKIGLLIFAGALVSVALLFNPFPVFLLLVATLSIEGFAAVEGFSYPMILGMIVMTGLLVNLLLNRGVISKDSSYVYFALFFIGSLVSIIVADELRASLTMSITYFSLFLLYFCTRYFVQDLKGVHITLNILFLSTVLAFAIVQLLGLSVRDYTTWRVSGGIGDANEFASFILVLLPLAFYRAMHSKGMLKLMYYGSVILFFALVIFSGSRGGLIGLGGIAAVFIYYYSYRQVKQALLFILILLGAGFFIAPQDYLSRMATILYPSSETDASILSRISFFHAALAMFMDHPLTGVGLANFRFHAVDYGALRSTVAHNTYLELLSGGGLITFIPFLLILFDAGRKLKVEKGFDATMQDLIICLKASFCSFLLTAFFLSAGHKKVLWLLLAMISSIYYLAQKAIKQQPLVRNEA